ncbi:alpha/beta hydrolase [Brevibacillus borstelensis]|uniref:alpha/beta family hydrolase n=1 Tax=Brevibacillus borstelensis TaxID=45462 RepID=UPI002E210C2E|nr:alpha/beta hydrolase [Brevibacillus borstelensis]
MAQSKMNNAQRKDGQLVPYTLIQRAGGGGRAICFICPGSSYSFDRPLLYYSTMLMLEQGLDVVHVHYSYGSDNTDYWMLPPRKRGALMLQDVEAVVRHVLADQPRKQLLFIGKSIGTLPIVSGFGESMLPSEASAILLTPLLNQEGFAESLLACKQNMYLVTGTADHYYHSETIEQIRDKHANIELDIVPNADHSLEIPFDTTVSLETLQQVFSGISRFTSDTLRSDNSR